MDKRIGEFWFVVGSQTLYGPQVLETVERRAREMAEELSRTLPWPLACKAVVKSDREITGVIREANYDGRLPPSTTGRSPTRRSTWTS